MEKAYCIAAGIKGCEVKKDENGRLVEDYTNSDLLWSISHLSESFPHLHLGFLPMSYIKEEQMIISIAAGKTITWFENEFGRKIKLVRSMPNTPAMVGEGCTGFCCNKNVTEEDREIAEGIFNSYGTSFLLNEELFY